MVKDDCMTFQQRSLFQQGYQRYDPQELKQLEWGLRFTPAACSLIAAYGLYTQQPAVLFAVAVLGFWAFFFPLILVFYIKCFSLGVTAMDWAFCYIKST